MRACGKYVAIESDGVVEVHAEGDANYATLCGLDGDDPVVGQRGAPLDIGARINCPHCIGAIRYARQFTEKDFAENLRLTKMR